MKLLLLMLLLLLFQIILSLQIVSLETFPSKSISNIFYMLDLSANLFETTCVPRLITWGIVSTNKLLSSEFGDFAE